LIRARSTFDGARRSRLPRALLSLCQREAGALELGVPAMKALQGKLL
jgi:hypothetical protein